LIINTDTPLAPAVAFQGFKAITWWDSQVGKLPRGIQQSQLSQRRVLNVMRKRRLRSPFHIFCVSSSANDWIIGSDQFDRFNYNV